MKEIKSAEVTEEQRILKRVLARELSHEELDEAMGGCGCDYTVSYAGGQPGDLDEPPAP